MAYEPEGLKRFADGVALNMWTLDTVDAVVAATAADYVTDAGPTDIESGRGMAIGDPVLIRVVDAVPGTGEALGACTDQAWAYVSALDAATGAGSLTAT